LHWENTLNFSPALTAPVPAVAACWLLLSLAVPGAQAASGNMDLPLHTCQLSLPGTTLAIEAECGWFEVAENPQQPQGRKIRLRVARVPAQERRVEPDPLLFFAGGPGQAASEAWLIVAASLKTLNKNRDVLLIDQRGTGQSNALRCPQMELSEALALDWDQLERTTRECLEQLPGDARYYTTTIAMQDYDRVRAALGYDQVNLFGVSYGTRAAQVYLRLYPEHVRTVVLDSVTPQDLALGTEHAQKLDQALHRVLSSCAADAACNAAYPQVEQDLAAMIRRLDASPVELSVDHPLTGRPFAVKFDHDALAAAIRFMTYSSETQALLPLLIHEAAESGQYGRLASQMLISASDITSSISQGMELSVICAEDFPLFPPPAADAAAPGAPSLMGDSMLKASRIQCGIWPRGEVPGDFHDPVVSDKPTLLLSGELDPVTPPEYAERVKAHFSNSLHLVAPGQGHSVSTRGCVGRLIADFVIAGRFEELDSTCLAQLRPSPWFMSLTGPEP
jgi:pimeloyl-ACP methyl ester carboxylesterase